MNIEWLKDELNSIVQHLGMLLHHNKTLRQQKSAQEQEIQKLKKLLKEKNNNIATLQQKIANLGIALNLVSNKAHNVLDKKQYVALLETQIK